jgi:hypothetical protein
MEKRMADDGSKPTVRLISDFRKEEPKDEGQSQAERKQKLAQLVDLYQTDRITYELAAKQFAHECGVSFGAVDAQVKILIEGFNLPDLDASTELIAIAQDAELWHSSLEVGHATIQRNGHLEHYRVDSREFRHWLSNEFAERHTIEINGKEIHVYPKKADLNEALYQIENQALQGEEKEPKIRVTHFGGELCIDLGRSDWQGVRIGPQGWRLCSPLDAPLVRGKGMLPLPIPVLGGSVDDLRPFVNLDGADFTLFCGTLASMYNTFGNYFTTILCGPSGSGKTTVTRVIRALTDPNAIASKRFSTTRDLLHANPYVVALENVSEISAALSDTICSLNTGMGYSERKYYAQGEEWSVAFHCPVIINGIPGNLASRPDLADRTVTFAFDYLGEKVRSDDVFWRKFNEQRPRLFGVILDGVVGAMRARQRYGGDNDAAADDLLDGWRTRFVDPVVFAEAACREMGFEPGEYVAAYKSNRDAGKRWIGENDPVCVGIRALILKVGSWQGYPEQLCKALRPHIAGRLVSSNWLTRRDLPNAIPILRDLYGIQVTMNKRLEQNDNNNGIIIEGVSRGRHSEDSVNGGEAQTAPPEIPTPTYPQPIPKFKRRI